MVNDDGPMGREGHALRLGFLMDQVAGHITNYWNLRGVAETDDEITPTWFEISYRREGGSIERWRDRWFPFVPTYFSGNARAGLELNRALRGEFDAIFTNAKVAVLFARKLRKTPTMIDFDATPLQLDQMEAYGGSNDPKPIAKLKWRLCRDMFQSAIVLQAWSQWAKDSAVNDYGVPGDKITVIPPGVNLEFWRPSSSAARPAAPARVLFVGGDFRRKGGDLLLEWFRGQNRDAVELHIVTKEGVASAPGVFVYGDIKPNSPELLALFHGADVFVLPSLGECFGIATVEAMAAGLPVVGSDVGGTADIIEPGGNGYITKAGDVRDLGAAVSSVLDDAGLRRSMAQRSRVLADERFDLQRNARRTLSLLKGIATPRAPATV